MKCKHQWDYIGNFRIGENPTILLNLRYAVWFCPLCDEEKRKLIKEMVFEK